jgi:lipoprotein-anchoring transpeptidase ErfK/SrfK
MKPFILSGLFQLIIFSCASANAASDFTRSLCPFHYPSDDRIPWECRTIKKNETPQKLFGKYWQDVLRFNRVDRRHFVAGKSIKVPKRLEEIAGFTPLPKSYPAAAETAKFILVDQSEMFIGAYAYGKLVFSTPAAVGVEGHRVPNGEFRIDAVDRKHESDVYAVEGTDQPYPMHYALRYAVDKLNWISFWIHGRDVPGHPASHGCIGLYDEEMQKQYGGNPHDPILNDARRLFLWVVGSRDDSGKFRKIGNGPRVLIVGNPPA